MSSFPYFAHVYRLLRVEAKASPAAETEIAACEKTIGFRLPAAVREWYSHEAADELIDNLLPRSEVLASAVAVARKRITRIVPFFRWGNERGQEMQFDLDGPDDPRVDSAGVPLNTPTTFTRIMEGFAWSKVFYFEEGSQIQFGRVPIEESPCWFGPPHLDWFLENFELLQQQGKYANPDAQGFEFFNEQGLVELFTDGDPRTGERQAHGSIVADTPDDAAKLFAFAWPLHAAPIRLILGFRDAATRRRVRNRIRKNVPGVVIQ
jgi:hypothetical protein